MLVASDPFSLPFAETRSDGLEAAEIDGSAEGCGASAPLPPLPCLFRNNSDKAAEFLTAAQRKTAHAIYMNVMAFVMLHGLENCGFFTVTFPDELTWQEAQRRLNNYTRRVLGPLFRDRIKVLEFTRNGRPHYHLIVCCGGDIRTGFNFGYLSEVAVWNRHLKCLGKEKPLGSLDRNPLLVSLHARLNATGGKYGVGRMELVPLKTCAEAVGRYVGGYLKKSVGGRKPEHKGARFVSYSRGFERSYKGNFTWVEGGRDWRKKVAIFAAKHGCSSMLELRALFGSKWAYHHGDSIRQIILPNEQTTTPGTASTTTPGLLGVCTADDAGKSSGTGQSDREGAGSRSCGDDGWRGADDRSADACGVSGVSARGDCFGHLAGAPLPGAASADYETGKFLFPKRGKGGTTALEDVPPKPNCFTNQAVSGGRRYTLGKRTMLPVHPRLHFQRSLQIS